MDIPSICNRLRQARRQNGFLSARNFALHHNIPDSTYTQHESGKRKMSVSTMLHYCKLLDIDPFWLLTGIDQSLKKTEKLSEIPLCSQATTEHLDDCTTLQVVDMDFLCSILYETSKQNNLSKKIEDPVTMINICVKIYNHFTKQPNYQELPNLRSQIAQVIANTLGIKTPSYNGPSI